MSDVWDTKDGRRRVRRDPPTVEDAAVAAQGLSDDLESQVEIVTSLITVTAEDARRAVLKLRRAPDDTRVTLVGRGGGTRAVVVERKSPRRAAMQSTFSAVRRRG
jgi:hypothetical protein